MTKIPLNKLKPGPYQSRSHFNPGRLLQLAQSIQEQGLIHPPLVAQNGSGDYHIIAGERRWRASAALALHLLDIQPDLPAAIQRVCQPNGPAYIAAQPRLAEYSLVVNIQAGPGQRLHVLAIIDNHQREDLNPIEEARDFQNLMESYGWSVYRCAKECGYSDPYVRGRLAWLDLEPEIQQLVAAGDLPRSPSVADSLALITDPPTRLKLAKRFASRRSTVAAIQHGCRRVKELMTEQAKQKTVALNRATVKQPTTNSAPPTPPNHQLCPADAAYIRHLAEEFCGPCSVHGLTADCLTCPGTIEFIEKLIQTANELHVG